jgi:hypothetical protein
MAKHKELGQLLSLDNPSPIQLFSLPKEFTDSQSELKHWLSSLCLIDDQSKDQEQDTSDGKSDEETTDQETEEPCEHEDETDYPISLDYTVEDQLVMQVSGL